MTDQTGDEVVRGYVRRVYGVTLVANYAGISIVIWYGLFALRVYPENRSPGRILFELLVSVVGPFIIVASVEAYYRTRRYTRAATKWLAEDRQPSQSDREALCRLPLRFAMTSTGYWIVGAVLTFPYLAFVIRLDTGIGGTIRFIISYALIAIIPWSLSFLLVELVIRPLIATTLTHEVEMPKTMGIRGRFLLAWVATSGLPIVGILLLLVGQDNDQRLLAMPALFTILALGTIAGIAIAIFSGRAIIDPISKVRSALRTVESGNLDAVIPVTDSSELGELQMGVNRMVLGLRERERMRELFGHHVGAEVASRALSGEGALVGERRDATAMFVDVIGSSYLVDREDPDEVVEILNRFFDLVVRVVAAEGGIVNKFEGDGALCVFGAPNTLGDHAERALRAGERLQRELSTIATDIGAAIGIASGSVAAGNIGAADRYEYTVIGRPVHVARRLCDEAKLTDARLLASETTISSAGAHDTGWVAADTVLLRGQSEMTATYRPTEG